MLRSRSITLLVLRSMQIIFLSVLLSQRPCPCSKDGYGGQQTEDIIQFNLDAGKLTAQAMCALVAQSQPEGTIMVDESLTSGTAYWEMGKVCSPFPTMHPPVLRMSIQLQMESTSRFPFVS